MRNRCVALGGLVLVVGLAFGCLSRTKVVAGPAQVVGEVEVFATPQTTSFEIGPSRIGLTVGNLGFAVESSVGPCTKVIGVNHSMGDPSEVYMNVPSLGSDPQ